jgi:hypothetical protein
MTNPNTRTWSDQPRELEGAEVLCLFSLERHNETHHVEVRRGPGTSIYLTFGNLFGSQTVLATDPLVAFRCIGLAGKSTKLPEGCSLLDNDKSNSDGLQS